MEKRAEGGHVVQSPRLDRVAYVLSPGLAVVPDDFPAALVEQLNGGPTEVITASEAMAYLDADD